MIATVAKEARCESARDLAKHLPGMAWGRLPGAFEPERTCTDLTIYFAVSDDAAGAIDTGVELAGLEELDEVAASEVPPEAGDVLVAGAVEEPPVVGAAGGTEGPPGGGAGCAELGGVGAAGAVLPLCHSRYLTVEPPPTRTILASSLTAEAVSAWSCLS